ncbi:organic cation transporter -like [Paramuricea clavata]|uniref:Organic cation transporter -like n=1 Tax=Paramuricea clavata TaxID=317549 RepID=A0A6S7IXP4_PARCT|nr:organic cation transporter -like [Paramuricea clavata]
MKSPDIERLLDTLGQPGRLQSISCFCLFVNLWVVMTNHMSSVFFAAKTEYSCIDKNTSSHVLPLLSRNGQAETDECSILINNNTEKCTVWDYHLPDGETTIISEFDLVCDDAYKSDLTTTIYFAGVMMGGVVFGILADKYGRKRVVISTLFLSGIVGVVTFVLRTYVAYVVLRFFLGFFMQGVQNSSFVLTMEMLPMKYRAKGGILFVGSGVFGVLLLDFLAFVIQDWKYVQLCTGLLPFLQVLVLWFLPGSLRWNIVQKNIREAEAIIQRTVTFNKLTFPQKLFDEIKNVALNKKNDVQDEQKKGNAIDIFRSPTLRKITFILFLNWFTFALGYYGLAFHISHLFGNKYLNFAISSIMDAIFESNLLWIVPRYGRRRPLTISFFICAVANVVCSIVASQSVSTSMKYLGTTMAIIGKSMIACSISIGYTYTSELYPTVVRNGSLGMNIFWARVGGMAAPQIFFLGTYTSKFVPYTILTALTLLCGFSTLLLPETNNTGMSDRLEISMTSLLDQQDDLINSDRTKFQCYETSI